MDRSGRGLLAADSQYRGRFLPHALRQYALLQDDYSPDDGPQGRRVVIVSEGPGGDITIGKDGLLRCGAYGIFRSEEDMLREEMDSEMEFAVRSATEDDGTF